MKIQKKANLADSGNGAVTFRLHVARLWRTVPEQQRWAA